MKLKNWREDVGIKSEIRYQRRFAYLPVTCTDGTKVWLKSYYCRYILWYSRHYTPESNAYHIDDDGCMSEADYIIRKIIEGF